MKPKLYDALTTLTVRSCTILPPSRAHEYAARLGPTPRAHRHGPPCWPSAHRRPMHDTLGAAYHRWMPIVEQLEPFPPGASA